MVIKILMLIIEINAWYHIVWQVDASNTTIEYLMELKLTSDIYDWRIGQDMFKQTL